MEDIMVFKQESFLVYPAWHFISFSLLEHSLFRVVFRVAYFLLGIRTRNTRTHPSVRVRLAVLFFSLWVRANLENILKWGKERWEILKYQCSSGLQFIIFPDLLAARSRIFHSKDIHSINFEHLVNKIRHEKTLKTLLSLLKKKFPCTWYCEFGTRVILRPHCTTETKINANWLKKFIRNWFMNFFFSNNIYIFTLREPVKKKGSKISRPFGARKHFPTNVGWKKKGPLKRDRASLFKAGEIKMSKHCTRAL